ncbi:myeloperoxidase [Patella vulgata]|uniref:myeloperoxidase n=1 Tax=Patella vulgata TaxID=6465 RepID=UPI0024A8C061|nr:myeloperoxidase [Patella vulgata]
MNFVRTVTVDDPKLKCKSGAREQKNTITSYIDGSSIYGSSEDEQKKLRQFQYGLLKVGMYGMLPEDVDGDCVKRNVTDFCLLAGDSRVNEHPGLSAFHTIFVRLHNRIAKQLRRLNIRNRLWNDEKLFQETRKIIAAILQHITYNEWLPLVVGPAATQKYRLKTTFGVMHRYDDNLDTRIINSFSTAAFRYGHSTIPNAWSYGDIYMLLVEMFNSPFYIVDHQGKGLNLIVEGMLKDSSQDTDHIFSDGVKNKLFQNFTVPGLDLAALNIQRGRDHGLPPYNKYRKYCGLTPIGFDGSTPQVRALERVYRGRD